MTITQANLTVTSESALKIIPQSTPRIPGKYKFQLEADHICVGNYALNTHRAGVTSVFADFDLHKDVELRLKLRRKKHERDTDVLLAFPISGRACIKPGKTRKELSIKTGQFAVWRSCRDQPIITSYDASEAIRYLAFRLPLSLLYEYFGEELQLQDHDICDNFVAPITPALQMAVHQYLSAPYHGATLRLFHESKVLEFMALSMDVFSNGQGALTAAYSGMKALGSSDIDRVYAARDYLVANMEMPPSLIQLSQYAGMNQQKLKCGFRQVFGMTAFSYLQQHRLEKARQLLEEGHLSVSEVALQVGYSHFGHFASIFRKQFGVTPKNVRQGRPIVVPSKYTLN